MRLVKNKIEHDGSGTVTLLPEEPEDMVFLAPLVKYWTESHVDILSF